jgi:peptidoglycan LD-endopeptidase LytH
VLKALVAKPLRLVMILIAILLAGLTVAIGYFVTSSGEKDNNTIKNRTNITKSPDRTIKTSPAITTPIPSPPPSPTNQPSAAPKPPSTYTFPVTGKADYGHTHALYPATDIFAPCGATVLAPTAGEVVEISRQDTFDPANPQGAAKGGLSVSIVGDDGVRYYGSHLSQVRADLNPGMRVASGEEIGKVGKTGNANNVCHLHFALSPLCSRAGDWWIRRGVVYPWSYLDSWRAGENRSPAQEVTTWQATNNCPTAPTN